MHTLNVFVFQFLALLVSLHVLLPIQPYIASLKQPYIEKFSLWLDIHGQIFLFLKVLQFQNHLNSTDIYLIIYVKYIKKTDLCIKKIIQF